MRLYRAHRRDTTFACVVSLAFVPGPDDGTGHTPGKTQLLSRRPSTAPHTVAGPDPKILSPCQVRSVQHTTLPGTVYVSVEDFIMVCTGLVRISDTGHILSHATGSDPPKLEGHSQRKWMSPLGLRHLGQSHSDAPVALRAGILLTGSGHKVYRYASVFRQPGVFLDIQEKSWGAPVPDLKHFSIV